MDNVELLKQGYQKFAEGKIEEVLAMYDPEIEWIECTGFPYISGDGISIGPQAVVQDVLMKIPQYMDNFQVEIKDIIGSGDKVVMEGYYTGVWKETGKPFRANAAHIWTVKDGKATRPCYGAFFTG